MRSPGSADVPPSMTSRPSSANLSMSSRSRLVLAHRRAGRSTKNLEVAEHPTAPASGGRRGSLGPACGGAAQFLDPFRRNDGPTSGPAGGIESARTIERFEPLGSDPTQGDHQRGGIGRIDTGLAQTVQDTAREDPRPFHQRFGVAVDLFKGDQPQAILEACFSSTRRPAKVWASMISSTSECARSR